MNSDNRAESEFSSDRARLEAEAAGNAALPDDAPANVQPDPAGKTNAEVERAILAAPRKTPADAARDAIYAKRTAERTSNLDESEVAMQAGAEAMMPSHTEVMEAEAAGRPVVARAADPAPLDSPENTITLIVEGREIKVSRADVEKAGIASLQKETNADFRGQRVALAEQAVVARGAELDRRIAEIERGRATPDGGATAPTARTDLPSGGTGSAGSTKQALEALLDSDVETAASRLDTIVAERTEAAVKRALATSHPTSTPAPSVISEADRVWPAEKRSEVDPLLQAAFPKLYADAALGGRFTARMKEEMANPVNIAGRVDLKLLALTVGQEVMGITATSSSRPAASSVQDELALRRTLAARVPGVPTPAGTRSVAPVDTGPAAKTRSQTVLEMRKSRGQA